MRWTTHIEGGPRHANHSAVCIDGKIYSFGGYCSTEEYKDSDPIPIHVLDTDTLRWSTMNYVKNDAVPYQRYGHTTVAYGSKVYMWGGRNNSVACDSLCCFDTKTNEWSTPNPIGILPYARDGHSACLIGKNMYIFGGYEYAADQYSQEVYCLDLDTLEWSFLETTGQAPSPRDFHTAVAINEKMYVFGGRGDLYFSYSNQPIQEMHCSHLFYLDTAKLTWVSVVVQGELPEGRRSHSAWVYKDDMYIFGGYNSNTKKHLNSLHRYSIKCNKWDNVILPGPIPTKRRRQACIMYKDKTYLFGGTSPCPLHEHMVTHGLGNHYKLINNNDLHVLEYLPTLKTLAIMVVLKHDLDQTWLPRDIIFDIKIMTLPNQISRALNQYG